MLFGFISKYRVWIKCILHSRNRKIWNRLNTVFCGTQFFQEKNLNKLLQMMGIMVFWDRKEETDYKEHEGRPHLYFTIVLPGKILAYLTTISDILSCLHNAMKTIVKYIFNCSCKNISLNFSLRFSWADSFLQKLLAFLHLMMLYIMKFSPLHFYLWKSLFHLITFFGSSKIFKFILVSLFGSDWSK